MNVFLLNTPLSITIHSGTGFMAILYPHRYYIRETCKCVELENRTEAAKIYFEAVGSACLKSTVMADDCRF